MSNRLLPRADQQERSGAAFRAVWAAHGHQLRALAAIILRNPAAAELVVVDVLATRCAGPHGIVSIPSRRELARLTYLRCLRMGAIDDSIAGRPERDRTDSSPASIALIGLRVLGHHQRAAVALVEFGDHTWYDVSELLGLSEETTTQLLAAGRRGPSLMIPAGREPGPGIHELLAMMEEEEAGA